jgi:hypothetical protein
MYSYICPEDHRITDFFHMDDAPTSLPCPVCKKKALRDYTGIRWTPPSTQQTQYSDALGCTFPDEAKLYREDARQHGVSIDFTPDGTAMFPSTREKEKYMKKYGWHHKGQTGEV